MRKVLLLIVATMSLATFAQKKPEPRQATKEIIFGDGDFIDDVDLSKPDVEYFKSDVGAKHASLLRVREEFKDKVMESARDL